MDKSICPRAVEDGVTPDSVFAFSGECDWKDNRCSYCGSLHPDFFMERLEAGTIELGPTDKSYKVYVRTVEGLELPAIKFYFQHLSDAQKNRFIELYNDGKMRINDPGYFYVHPYFCKPEATP